MKKNSKHTVLLVIFIAIFINIISIFAGKYVIAWFLYNMINYHEEQSHKIKSENEVIEYLKNTYPEEEFTVIKEDKNDSEYKYLVKSNNTNIEFYVEENEDGNEIDGLPGLGKLLAGSTVENNYIREAIKQYCKDFEDKRLQTTNGYYIDINLKDFQTDIELAKTIQNFKSYIISKQPLNNSSFSMSFKITDNNGSETIVRIEEILQSEEDVKKYLSNKYKKEEFTINNDEKIILKENTELEGILYHVTSKSSNVEFEVYSTFDATENQVFSKLGISDNYIEKALNYYINEFDNNKIGTYKNNIILKKKDFSSIDEMNDVINKILEFIIYKDPFSAAEYNTYFFENNNCHVVVFDENEENVTRFHLDYFVHYEEIIYDETSNKSKTVKKYGVDKDGIYKIVKENVYNINEN